MRSSDLNAPRSDHGRIMASRDANRVEAERIHQTEPRPTLRSSAHGHARLSEQAGCKVRESPRTPATSAVDLACTRGCHRLERWVEASESTRLGCSRGSCVESPRSTQRAPHRTSLSIRGSSTRGLPRSAPHVHGGSDRAAGGGCQLYPDEASHNPSDIAFAARGEDPPRCGRDHTPHL